ncbi:MAG: dinitrogenase iron-molybdenum cofactor biosynthesis protein [Ardenticatenaceae bacterium]|nr:dinitrogenase iron-molybdenum cofactor biosynthesis protein [Ardenticatenaceae bacterium]MCB9442960.1 dinitrogenase iron-molybdenum cofactor biosynthesis protein [Ardenticatenaceae bacterium]
MKIAVITDDGKTISAHFGRAEKCAVIEVEDGNVVGRELRDKPGHAGGEHDHDHDHEHDHQGGSHHHGQHRFHEKLAVMDDCQVVLCRGMGNPAYEKLVQAGLQPILTDIVDIETAVQAYLAGTIIDNPRRRHQ